MLAISSRYEGELYLIPSLGQHGNITYKPLASYLFTSCFEPIPSSPVSLTGGLSPRIVHRFKKI